jgi:hypothetical protein
MRIGLVSIAALSLFGSQATAQLKTTDAGTAKLLQADFAVPDAPALAMLDADASKLLRPVTVRELTAGLSSASGDFSFIPRAFAVEFAPFMLRNGERLSLAEYRKKPWLYRTRLSFATKRDTGAVARSQLATAFRMVFQDKSDLRTNTEVSATLLELTSWQLDSATEVKDRWVKAGIPRGGPLPGAAAAIRTKAANIEKAVAEEHAAAKKPLVEAAKKAQENAKWNAAVFDAAIGFRGSAADSTGGGPQFDGLGAWLTKGWAVCTSCQLLIGGRVSHERNLADTTSTDLEGAGDLAVRFYLGSNNYKALTELQATGRAGARPGWLAKVGGELHLSATLWVEASLGFQAQGKLKDGKVQNSFKVKFAPAD